MNEAAASTQESTQPEITQEQVERLHADQVFHFFMRERDKWIRRVVHQVIPANLAAEPDTDEKAAKVRDYLSANGYAFAPIANGFSMTQHGEPVSAMRLAVQYADRKPVIETPSIIIPGQEPRPEVTIIG